jgi:F-type H+-transporting ATPase subunit epsilon
MALQEQHIDEAAAQAAMERAQARIREAAEKGAQVSSEEIAAVQVMLAKSLAQLKVKRRHH